MSLIQRNAVPLFILLAVITVGVGVLLSQSPFAFGEEPPNCDASAVGISIITTDESGRPASVVSHGDVISYTVNLSIPELPEGETACNFGGGTITITLPNGEQIAVAGTTDTETIPTVSRGAVFTTAPAQYIVNQNAGVLNASGNVELGARADYSGGTTFSAIEGEEAVASQTKLVQMIPPSVVINVAPAGDPGADTQTVYQGQEAVFQITVTNTGGFELSNIAVSDSLAPDCNRAAGSLETLPVGASTEPYSCGVIPNAFITNEAIVTATATATTTADAPVEMEVTNSDTTEVVFGEVEVGIVMAPTQQIVRIGGTASIELTVSTPSVTALDDVTVTIVSVNGAASQDVTECDIDLSIGRVEADADVPVISCSPVLPQGTNTVTAKVSGRLPGTVEPLPEATATVFVEVIAPGLGISVTSGAEMIAGVPTVRKGAEGPLTIVVSNNGDSSLSDVTVVSLAGYPEAQDCDRPLNLGQLAAEQSESIQCSSGILQAESTFIFTVDGIASDGSTEGAESAPVTIDILDSSTAIGLSGADNTVVLRLVVQTLTVTETNDGDSALSDVYVELQSNGTVPLSRGPLTRNSVEYVGGDLNNDSILDPGETWEWRVVTVSVAGDVVLLPGDAQSLELTVTGFGTDELGGLVTFDTGDVEERGTLEVPIMAR